MPALMVVVLHMATQLLAQLGDSLKGPAVNQLGCQGVKERLHVRVLVGCAAARHALSDTSRDQALLKRNAQKLAAAIAVKDHAGFDRRRRKAAFQTAWTSASPS